MNDMDDKVKEVLYRIVGLDSLTVTVERAEHIYKIIERDMPEEVKLILSVLSDEEKKQLKHIINKMVAFHGDLLLN
jgi:hypothetical protein